MLLVLLACTPTSVSTDPATTDPVAPTPVQDPFEPLPPRQSTLTDVSDDLEAVLEHGALQGACEQYEADPTLENELLCGKAMFFYEDFEGAGVPTAVFDFLGDNFPNQVGRGHHHFGLVEDPYHPSGRPLGFPPALPMPGGAQTVAFGCAACHFGKLPDGRYAVGMPNLDYDYGGHMLTVGLAPNALVPGFSPADYHPDAIEAASPVIEELQARPLLAAQFGLALLPLLGEEAPAMSIESQGYYAGWEPGTMDFTIEPLPIDDGVHVVTRILPLWEIPAEGEAHLAWTGAAPTLMDFLEGFIQVTGSATAWPPERLRPLETYLLSLRAPVNPDAPTDIDQGREVFQRDCLECHAGPRGSGLELYPFEEVGTDDALRYWADPDLDGEFCCGAAGAASHAVKAPRMSGLWTQSKLLHNGSVHSLEALFCLEERRGITETVYGDGGHEYGCELPTDEREALVRYLLSI